MTAAARTRWLPPASSALTVDSVEQFQVGETSSSRTGGHGQAI
jgi:hypothetical protein